VAALPRVTQHKPRTEELPGDVLAMRWCLAATVARTALTEGRAVNFSHGVAGALAYPELLFAFASGLAEYEPLTKGLKTERHTVLLVRCACDTLDNLDNLDNVFLPFARDMKKHVYDVYDVCDVPDVIFFFLKKVVQVVQVVTSKERRAEMAGQPSQ
jgi:hypothetical protein